MPQNNSPVPSDQLKRIIQDGDAKALVIQAEKLGKIFGKKKKRGKDSAVSTNQIRAIFSTVRQIEMNWPASQASQAKSERELTLLKPKVMYRAAREKTDDKALKLN